MHAGEFKVQDILTRNERFIVPLYQRQYQWHDKWYGGETSAFWSDVSAKAADVLDRQPSFDHYMGALILAPVATQYGMTPIMQVVDGQQRLTTFLILVSAIRQIAAKEGRNVIADQCKKYLFNQPDLHDQDPLVQFKLTPTPVDRGVFFNILNQPLDEVRDLYRHAYRAGRLPQNTEFTALRAYEFFIAQVADFVVTGPGDDTVVDIDKSAPIANLANDHNLTSRRLDALLAALTFHLKLIVITLAEGDDAQVIFETLNSRGRPLLAMDLVRNNIFHRAEAEAQDIPVGAPNRQNLAEQLYADVWLPFDHAWWRAPAPTARPQRPRIDHFLANLLTAETGKPTTVRELYAEYRNWATPNGQPRFAAVNDELAVLQRHAPTYRTLEDPQQQGNNDETILWLGERLRMWGQTTAYSIAFQIAADHVDAPTRGAIAKLLDSYLTRRALCDLTSKNLNRLFPRLASALRDDGVSLETVYRFFEEQDSPTARFPDNDELRTGIRDKVAYGRIPSRILWEILWGLEVESRDPRTEATPRPQQLSVEHIMPVTPGQHWPVDNGDGKPVGQDDPNYWECRWRREHAINSLGNLTIVTQSLNSSLSNLPFHEKKEKLIEYSNLTLNRRIAEREAWDEAAIRDRGETLARLACKVWPMPTV